MVSRTSPLQKVRRRSTQMERADMRQRGEGWSSRVPVVGPFRWICPWDMDTCIEVAMCGRLEWPDVGPAPTGVRGTEASALLLAVGGGHLECL